MYSRNGLIAIALAGFTMAVTAAGTQQTPPPQCGYARWMHDMGGHRVASERRLVHEQHAMPAAREQHRRRSTGAASADHDHVITVGHW